MMKTTQLTKDDFLKKVDNYEAHPEIWKFEGEKPCIVDFYAEWCGSSKMITTILDELAVEYAGRIDIYQVNADKEEDLITAFGIRNIPSLLFCPVGNKPRMAKGAMSKSDVKKAINDVLLQ